MPARILVVDDDPWILQMVASILEKRGHVVDTGRDGQEALEKARAAHPDLVISDIMMPVMDGWTLLSELRSIPALATVPFLFLTALGKDEGALQSKGLQPEEYLAKPFRFAELEKRVAAALSRATSEVSRATSGRSGPPPPPAPNASRAKARPEPQPAPTLSASGRVVAGVAVPTRSTALNGRLEQLALSSLLVMMEMERKDGVLTVKDAPSGVIGRLFLRRGQVVCARLDECPERDGKACVYEMLTWQSGSFTFNAMEVEMDDTVQASTTHLLMEGARLIDEANRDASS